MDRPTPTHDRDLRVAMVCGAFRPDRDGVADYTRRLVRELPAYGVQAAVVTAGREVAPGAIGAATRWDWPGAAAVARAVRQLRPDLVHVQFAPSAYGYHPAVGTLPLLLGPGRPLVTTLHEYGWWSWPARVPGPLWRPLERRGCWDRETLALAPRSTRLVATNAPHAQVIRDRLGRPVDVIPVGPNVEPVGAPDRAAVRRELGVPDGALLLAFFGFVHPVKGLRHLLDALPALPGVHLLVVGGVASLALPGAQAVEVERELRRQVERLGLRDRVRLTGWLPGPAASRLLAAADAGVLPFTAGVTTKSSSLHTLTAHGLPVLVTRADPPDPELVDGLTVLHVDRVRDAAALAAAVRRLRAEPALAVRVAVGGARLAAGRSATAVAAAHARLYAAALEAAAW